MKTSVREKWRTIKNGQSTDTDNIGYTRHRMKTSVREKWGAIKNGQSTDTDNIGYTRVSVDCPF
jgi:hypothetical protein